MEVRIQILQHFGKTMDETIDQVNKLKATDKAKIVPTSILQFIPEADIVTNEELYGLKLLGLEVAFTVKKKKKFSWQAFGVFLLGIGQAIVGVGITVLSGGTLISFGMGLISEGVSDIIDGVQGMITGEFDLKDWAISKACSIAISVACGGVGKFIARGAKAAVKGIKAAKGFRSGAKALAKSAKAGKSAVKSGAKAADKDAKVMWKVAKSGRGTVISGNLKNAGKLVGKELLLQGAMCGLNKVENMALEQIFKAIGTTVAQNIKPSLQTLFNANDEDSLGHIVSIIFERADHTSQENIKIVHEFFELATDHVVESLVQNDSTAFDESAKVFRDKLLPGISSHLKGKAAGVAGLIEVGFVSKSIATASQQLSQLNGKFEVELVDQCKVALKDREIDQHQQTMHQDDDELAHLKRMLAEHTAAKFGEAVTSVLQQNLSWAVSRGLSKTVNGVAAGHMSKKLKVQETKMLLKAGGQRNYLLKASPTPVKKVDKMAMKSHADGVLNVKKSGTLGELAVAANKYNCEVVIVDSKLKRKCSLEPSSGVKGAPQITLIHYSKHERPPEGHYDVLIKGQHVKVDSVGNSCMFEAFARGINNAAKIDRPIDGLRVRRAIHNELTRHPEKWQEHFQRKELLEQIQKGDFLLQGGAGKRKPENQNQFDARNVKKQGKRKEANGKKRQVNKCTAIEVGAGTYARVMLNKNLECISYVARNGLEVTSITKYDRQPRGRRRQLKRSYLPGEQTVKVSDNDINMVAMHVEAKKCNFEKNIGRCLFTHPSFKQITFAQGHRDVNSSPVSFHLVPSEAGANAGTFFGNSVVTSEHYNKQEAEVRKEIKKFVDEHYGDRTPPDEKNFTCVVKVEFEDLIPPGHNGLKSFLEERNRSITDRDKVVPMANLAKLTERFERIGEIATTDLDQGHQKPQVQRVSSLVYEVTLPNGDSKTFEDLGCDYELYVHSGLHSKPSRWGFNNEDLDHARPSKKQIITAASDSEY